MVYAWQFCSHGQGLLVDALDLDAMDIELAWLLCLDWASAFPLGMLALSWQLIPVLALSSGVLSLSWQMVPVSYLLDQSV